MNTHGAKPCTVVMGAEAVAASTPYVLVDLSDVTNFPHKDANCIHLEALRLVTEKATDGIFDIWVGVVKEVDGTDGSVEWLHVWHMEAVGNPTDSTDRFLDVQDFTRGGARPDGLSLQVLEDGSTPAFVSYASQDDNVNWQTDEALGSPVGTSAPGKGDLVFWVEEVSGSGTIDFMLTAEYFTT